MLWVTIDGSGATKMLACSLLLDETADSISWSCEMFRDCFRVVPAVIFADGAPAIKAALDRIFPEPVTKQLLCIWHLSKNMMTHLRPAVAPSEWNAVSSTWWRVVQQTDATTRESFDNEWAEFRAMVESRLHGSASTRLSALAWIDERALDKGRWAYRFTWQYRTLGVHSNQRIEAVHGAVDHFLGPRRLLVDFVDQMDAYCSRVDEQASTRELRYLQRVHVAAGACANHPFMDVLSSAVTAFALMLVKAQLQQSMFYIVNPAQSSVSNGDGAVFSVSRSRDFASPSSAPGNDDAGIDHGMPDLDRSMPRTVHIGADGNAICSCQFPNCYGLPCRHILRVWDVRQMQGKPGGDIYDTRWLQRSDAAAMEALLRLLERPPPGRNNVAPAEPTRAERYALLMGQARAVADLGATTAATYDIASAALTRLAAQIRGGGTAAAAPPRGARQHAAAAAAAAPEGRQCHACWGYGHNANNRQCPRFGQAALPHPDEAPTGQLRVTRRRRAPLDLESDTDAEDADDSASDSGSGDNDNVCHACNKPGAVVCCSRCPRVWCKLRMCLARPCIPPGSMSTDVDQWLCPVCTGSRAAAPVTFVGAPPQPPTGRGGGQREKRKRSAGEGSPGQRAEAKKRSRGRELRSMGNGWR